MKTTRNSFITTIAALALLGVAALPQDAQAQTTVFNYTGAIQNYNVPAGVTSVTVFLWGAGGGVRNNGAVGSSLGGGGAFVTGTLSVTPGSVLDLIVGGGGSSSTVIASRGTSAFGGGGFTGQDGSGGPGGGGDGGGRTAIRAQSGIVDLVTVGAGGGGGYTGQGGAGGLGTGTSASGGGGTQIAGGAAGGTNATAGGQYFGGNSLSGGRDSGGAGGSGYFGGGGGRNGFGNSSPGGGGSSYTSDPLFTFDNALSAAGSATTPGGLANPNYVSGVGVGSSTFNVNGGNGLLVIVAASGGGGAAPEPGTLALLALGMVGGIIARRRK